MRLCFNNDIRLYKYDGASEDDLVLCEIPSTDDRHPNRYIIPANLLDLLRRINGSKSTPDAISEYLAAHPEPHSRESLERLVNTYCVPKGFLVESGSRHIPPLPASNRAEYLSLKIDLLPAWLIRLIGLPLRWLFIGKIVLAFIPLFVAVQIFFFFHMVPAYGININGLQGGDAIKLLLLLTIFGLVHELGHATALVRYGGRQVSIGWGLYLTYPVFYTDLSESWRLKRRERAMVDIGGIYFHGIVCVVLALIASISYQPLLVYCFYGVSIQIATSLNPFLRMDAYWLVADIFGIANMRQYMVTAIANNIYWILGKAERLSPAPTQASLGRRSATFLWCYSILTIGFFLVLYLGLLYQTVFNLIPAYPGNLLVLMEIASSPPIDWVAFANRLLGLIFRTLAVAGFGFILWRAARRLVILVRSVTRSTENLSLLEKLLWALLRPKQSPGSSKP